MVKSQRNVYNILKEKCVAKGMKMSTSKLVHSPCKDEYLLKFLIFQVTLQKFVLRRRK